jgi:hypothetical protein
LGVEDVKALHGIVSKDDYREVLQFAPAGVFDVRSWAYWNLVCGRHPTPLADAQIASGAPNATVNPRPSAARLLWYEQR